MNARRSRFLSLTVVISILLGGGTFGAVGAWAGDKYAKDYRRHDGQAVRAAAVEADLRRHERDRRAFIAGAAAQQHRVDNRDYYRNNYRDGYQDRYRDRYYDDRRDNDDGKIGAALVGAAVGAVVIGVVMSNTNQDSSGSDSKK